MQKRYSIEFKLIDDNVKATCWVSAESWEKAVDTFKQSKMYRQLGENKVSINKAMLMESFNS